MGFPPKGVLYKSPTSILLQNGELTSNEKKKTPKIDFEKTLINSKIKKKDCSLNVIHGCFDTNC